MGKGKENGTIDTVSIPGVTEFLQVALPYVSESVYWLIALATLSFNEWKGLRYSIFTAESYRCSPQ